VNGCVAVFADRPGRRMAGSHSRRGEVVVAPRATEIEAGVVEARQSPILFGVAGGTLQRGRDVPERFAFGDDIIVAAFAGSRGSLKDPGAVAFLAFYGGMRPIQRKASFEMVETVDDAGPFAVLGRRDSFLRQ